MHQITASARRLASLLVNLLLAAVMLVCGAYLLPHLVGYQRYVVTGGSMSGTIEQGSIVYGKPKRVEDLRVGDVITYLPPAESGVDTLVTHRIAEITPDDRGELVMRTKGDANESADPWTFSLAADEQPVVEHTVPHLGWALLALADREIRMLVIGGPALVVALLALVELVRGLAGPRSGSSIPGEPAPAAGNPHPAPEEV